MVYEPRFENGKLVCFVCGETDAEIGLVWKRGEPVYLCKKCQMKNPCWLCKRWARILTNTPQGSLCSRCH